MDLKWVWSVCLNNSNKNPLAVTHLAPCFHFLLSLLAFTSCFHFLLSLLAFTSSFHFLLSLLAFTYWGTSDKLNVMDPIAFTWSKFIVPLWKSCCFVLKLSTTIQLPCVLWKFHGASSLKVALASKAFLKFMHFPPNIRHFLPLFHFLQDFPLKYSLSEKSSPICFILFRFRSYI